jgi:hypothetical protein
VSRIKHRAGALLATCGVELQGFTVLQKLQPTLTTLSLGATRSPKPHLEALGRFTSLKALCIEGQSNGIEVLGQLRGLEDVTLRSITTADLRYLSPFERLWSLDITLGGIQSFDGIEGKDTIEHLELWQIRKLEHARVVASLPGPQHVFLQSLPRVKGLPRLDECRALRRVWLENMKGLVDVEPFETAPALEEFVLVDGSRQQTQQLVPLLRNPALRRVRGGLWECPQEPRVREASRNARQGRWGAMDALRVSLIGQGGSKLSRVWSSTPSPAGRISRN